jgi:hypothetical protein
MSGSTPVGLEIGAKQRGRRISRRVRTAQGKRNVSKVQLPPGRKGNMNRQIRKPTGWSWWYLLFIIQFVAVLWPPFFNKAEPTLIGLPFFYWYQLLWIIIGAILTATVHFATDD